MECVIELPKRHPGQELVYAQRERFNVLACGRRFGKTTLFLDLLIDDPDYGVLFGYPCAWYAGTSKIFDEVWRLAKVTLEPVIKRVDSQKHRIELTTGGILDFWSLEGGDRHGAGRGRKYRRAAIDEGALVPDLMAIWQKTIRPTLVDLRGDGWFASTPRGRQNDYFELFERGQDGNKKLKNWKSFQLPSSSNPYLSREELEDMRMEYVGRPLDYNQEMLAEFVSDFGEVFNMEWFNEGELPEGLILYQAWDVAVTGGDMKRGDWSVGVTIGLDSSARWWLVDVVRGKWKPDETIERMFAFQRKHEASEVWIEGGPIGRAMEPWLERRRRETGQAFSYSLVSHTARADDLSDTKLRGVRKIANTTPLVACMASNNFYVPRGAAWLPELKAELASFPGGKHDDQVDALSMAFLKTQQVRESTASRPRSKVIINPANVLWDESLDVDKPTRSKRLWKN